MGVGEVVLGLVGGCVTGVVIGGVVIGSVVTGSVVIITGVVDGEVATTTVVSTVTAVAVWRRSTARADVNRKRRERGHSMVRSAQGSSTELKAGR